MKRNLAFVCAAAAVAGCQGITLLSAPSRTSGEVFASVADSSLFGACLQTVHLAGAPGVSFSKACADAFGKSGVQAASVDCSELAGRASEAVDEHFLGDGRLMCGRLVRERSFAVGRPLASFAPAEGSPAASVFCDAMKVEALSFCVPAAAMVAAATDAFMPAAAVAPARPQAAALRAAEVKLVRAAPSVPQPPQQQPVVQPAARLDPVVTPQMAEAAQTIAAGMWPAFARQVPQALAAGQPGLAAPMNAKAAQQPDLNNGGIWTNLAALLHRSG